MPMFSWDVTVTRPGSLTGGANLRNVVTGIIPSEHKLKRLSREATEDIAEYTASQMRHYAPYSTGKLYESIRHTQARSNGVGFYEASAYTRVKYASWVDRGTGMWGPLKAPIFANLAGNVDKMFRVAGPWRGTRQTRFPFYFHKSLGQKGADFSGKAARDADKYTDYKLALLKLRLELNN